MAEWKTCKLSDLGDIVGGATPSTKDESNYGGDIPWITPKDLSNFNGRYINRGERNITEKGLRGCSTVLLPANSILFSSRAPIGYVAIAANPVCTNQGFKSVVPNTETDSMFLYYLLLYNKNNIEALGSGTTFKEVSGSTMRNVEVRVPVDIETQKRIASVLSSIDEKIETNQRINDNLAQQLQCAYMQQYGSPDQINGTLADICSYARDRIAVSTISRTNYFSTENMLPNKQGYIAASSLPTTEYTPKCEPGQILVSNIRPYFKKILLCREVGGCSADVLCFVAKHKLGSAYVYSTLYSDRFFDFMVAGSKGTKMPRGDKQQIMQYPVHVPTEEELGTFADLAKPILGLIASNNKENKALSELRDGLLPRLMSGEIDVSDIRI